MGVIFTDVTTACHAEANRNVSKGLYECVERAEVLLYFRV